MQANIRRIVSILLAVMFCVACFTGCGSSNNGGSDTASVDVRNAKTIADLKGAKIAAQAGTFHADALSQIPDVQSSTYPEFADLLTALKSGAIDGYIAEEPTALSVCGSNDELTYLPFKNNDTGFTATAADVGIAIGLKKGNALRDQINTVLPHDTTYLGLEENKDLCTLVTCTPFGVNTHRLLVRGHRISYTPENTDNPTIELAETEESVDSTWEQEYEKGVYLAVGIVALICLILFIVWLTQKGENNAA